MPSAARCLMEPRLPSSQARRSLHLPIGFPNHDLILLLTSRADLSLFLPSFFTVEPYLEIAYTKGSEYYTKIEPYRPEELFTFVIGFVLCFYGGAFCTTIVTHNPPPPHSTPPTLACPHSHGTPGVIGRLQWRRSG